MAPFGAPLARKSVNRRVCGTLSALIKLCRFVYDIRIRKHSQRFTRYHARLVESFAETSQPCARRLRLGWTSPLVQRISSRVKTMTKIAIRTSPLAGPRAQARRRRTARCGFCKEKFKIRSCGRPPIFCSRSCRQRASRAAQMVETTARRATRTRYRDPQSERSHTTDCAGGLSRGRYYQPATAAPAAEATRSSPAGGPVICGISSALGRLKRQNLALAAFDD